MSTVQEKFKRDVSYLSENQVPMEPSGLRVKKLDYEVGADDEQKLTDDNVMELSQALMKNDVFQGPLDLSKNGLSDLVSYILIPQFFEVMPLSQGCFDERGSCQHYQA